MPVSIVKVENKSQLKKFIRFPHELYRNCTNWVPALDGDEYDTLSPKRNVAFDFCEAELYLAYKDGKLCGRVAAIINHKANQMWNSKSVRFGWLDFTEDEDVLRALLDAVEKWGRERGCDNIKGPLGFTDMDKEGLLVEGYEHLSPFTCLYNYPYYDTLLQKVGYQKDVDWTQKLLKLSSDMPAMYQLADTIQERYGLHMAQGPNMFNLSRRYGMALFHLCNEAFAPLFQFVPLTDKQIKRYLQTYIPILDKRYVAICLNDEDKPVGFAFCVPSLSKAVKKSGGKLFPLGLFRILHALRHNDQLEALMIGVLPEYQGKGASLLLAKYIHENCIDSGIKEMIMNPQLEQNFKVQSMWDQYDPIPFMRRRAYKKQL